MELINDFMGILGVNDISGLIPVKIKNRSINAKQVKFLSELNRQLPTWDESVNQQKKEDYYKANRVRMQAMKILQQLDSFNASPGIASIISEKDKITILDKFSGDNAQVAQTFFKGKQLFPKHTVDPSLSVQETSVQKNLHISTKEYIDVVIKSLQKIDALEQELEQVKSAASKQVEEIIRSTSWRLTSPLRYVKKIISWKKR